MICTLSKTFAFKFSPMNLTINSWEKKQSKNLTVFNDGNEPIAIQISITKREMNEFGIEKHPEVDKKFLIYPPQLILGPKERRAIKITRVTLNIPSKEEAYRIIAEQLPVTMSKNKSKNANIKILMKYIGALYVDVSGSASNIQFEKAYCSKKDKKLHILMQNTGTRHQVLYNLRAEFTQNGKRINKTGKPLKGVSGGNILAMSRRHFLVDCPKKMLFDIPVKMKFEFDDL